MEHGGPEDGVEVNDVLADEVVDFEFFIVPVVEGAGCIFADFIAPRLAR